MTTKTAMETMASDVVRPDCARPAAAPRVSTRFLGFTAARTTARPNAFAGDTPSMVAIHFGISGSVPSGGRLRHWRRARSTRATPSTILPHETESLAVVLVATFPSCEST